MSPFQDCSHVKSQKFGFDVGGLMISDVKAEMLQGIDHYLAYT